MGNKTPAFPETKPKLFYGYIIMASIFGIMMMVFIVNLAFGVFFKPVSDTFNWNRAEMSAAFSLSSIMVGIAGIVMGSLNDKVGPRIISTISGILLVAGYLLMSQINSLWQLYLFYGIIIGFGSGCTYVPCLSTLLRWFTSRRALVTGIVLVGAGVGNVIGPPIANKIIDLYGWQTSYIVFGASAGLIILVAAQFLKRDPAKMGMKPFGDETNPTDPANIKGLSLRESSRTWSFWAITLVEFIYGYAAFTIMIHLVPHITDLGISANTAALMLATVGGAGIAGRLILGPVGDRVGNRRIFIVGFFIFALDFFFLVWIKEAALLYIFCAIFGLFYGGMQASESPLVAWLFGLRSHGAIFGVNGFSFALGSAVGSFVAGYVFDVYGSYNIALVIVSVMALIAFGLSLTFKSMVKE